MGLLARAFALPAEKRYNPLENPNIPVAWKPVADLIDWAGGGPSDSGMIVSQESAVRLTAFWCGVRLLAETVASVPLCVYRRVGRGREKAPDHPLWAVLHDQANPEQSSYFWREFVQAQMTVHGNGYSAIRRNGAGAVAELWPLQALRVEPRRDTPGAPLVYYVTLADGRREPWSADEILHMPGLSFDGLRGKSNIAAARDAIGVGLAAQKYAAQFYRAGGRVPGVIQTQFTKMDPETKANLQETWLSGRNDNWHKVAFLPKGMEYKAAGIPPDDAQFLESRKFGVIEIARILNIPPHLLKDLERATFGNIEHQSLEFVVYTMRPIYVRWEQELNRKLLTPEERKEYYVAFNMEGLLRGDIAARGQFYALGRQWGWLSANDVLELEDMPNLGPKGDVYLAPVNMVNAEEMVTPAKPVPPQGLPPAGAQGAASRPAIIRELAARSGIRGLALRRRIRKSQEPIIEDRAAQIVRREIGAVEKMLKGLRAPVDRERRDRVAVRRELDAFYRGHAAWAGQKMRPVIHSYGELVAGAMADELGSDAGSEMPAELQTFVKQYSDRFGVRESSDGRLQLLALLDQAGDDEEAADLLQQRLDDWSEKRAGKIAVNESVRFMAAAAKVLYIGAGVTVLRWVANPGACDFCSNLDGQVAGVEKNFVDAGDGVDGADGEEPMRPSDDIGHPPLHSSCECDIVAD